VDIANLTNENIIDDRLKYQRQKTHGDINLTLLPQAKKIIALFSEQEQISGYLFPILNKNVHITAMQKHNRIRKLTRQINNALKEIGAELRIKENLTTYVARHTFATVLKKSGVNVGIISQALGHQDLKTTQIYLDSFDNEQIDEVMTKLL
jgi:integrase